MCVQNTYVQLAQGPTCLSELKYRDAKLYTINEANSQKAIQTQNALWSMHISTYAVCISLTSVVSSVCILSMYVNLYKKIKI